MKKILSVIFAFVMIISCFGNTLSVFAYGEDEITWMNYDQCVEQLREAMKNCENPITIYYECPQSSNTIYDLIDQMDAAARDNPEAFDYGDYVNYTSSLNSRRGSVINENGSSRYTLRFTYEYRTTAQREEYIDEVLDSVFADFNFNEETSEFVRIKTIYDWVCNNVAYAYSAEDYAPLTYGDIHTAYGALKSGYAVCEGYAMLMTRMLSRAGIYNKMVYTGAEFIGHVINIVRIGDLYYNVDSTWDSGEMRNYRIYRYFLLNDYNFNDINRFNSSSYYHERRPEYSTTSFYARYPMSEKDYEYYDWSIENGVLKVESPDYDALPLFTKTGSGSDAPWYQYKDSITSIEIDESINRIGQNAFRGLDKVTQISLHEGMTYIGDSSFENCSSLESVSIPESITEIGGYAFNSCSSLQSVTLPQVQSKCGSNIFSDCTSLTSIVIPDAWTEIPKVFLSGCSNLAHINLPSNIIKIGDSAFSSCPKLEITELPENLQEIGESAFSSIKFPENLAIPESVTKIGRHAFINCRNSITFEGHIPQQLGSYIVQYGTVYYRCDDDLPENKAPHSTWISYHAEENIKTIPPYCEENGYTLSYCESCGEEFERTNIVPALGGTHQYTHKASIPATCEAEGYEEYECSICGKADKRVSCEPLGHNYIYTVTTAAKCEEDGLMTYTCSHDSSHSYTEVIPATGHTTTVIEDIITEAGCENEGSYDELTECSVCGIQLEYVTHTIPARGHNYENGVCTSCGTSEFIAQGSCGNNAFWTLSGNYELRIYGTGAVTNYNRVTLNSVQMADTPWKDYTTSIRSVVVEEGITSLSYYLFENASGLVSVVIPETISVIPYYCFFKCSSLKEVSLPHSLKKIDVRAFGECISLENIEIPYGLEILERIAFSDCSSLKSIVLPETITSYGEQVFSFCSSLTEIVLPQNMTTIPKQFLKSTRSLKSIALPSSLKTIGESAFYASGLFDIELPGGLKEIGKEAFAAMAYPTTVVIPETVTKVGYRAFAQMTELTSVTFLGNETEIADNVFYSCMHLTNVILPNDITSIGNEVFKYCHKLSTVTLPEKLETIGRGAFEECKLLNNLTIPAGVTEISENAFRKCENISVLTFEGNLPHIGANAFNGMYTELVYPCSSTIPEGIGGTLTLSPVHGEIQNITVPGSCTQPGAVQTVCSGCGKVYSSEIIDSNPNYHNYTSVVTAPTCTEGGYTTYTCSACGDTYTADETTAAGHTPDSGAVTKAATCTETGVRTFKCSVCGAVTGTEVIAKTNHSYETIVTAPTCTEGGYTTYACSSCGDTYTADETTAAGHTPDSGTVTKAATCTETGIKTFKCSVCGVVTGTEVIAKTNHSYESVETTPTCTEGGFTTYTCSSCGDIYTADETTATGHTPDSGTITKAATCTETGIKTFKCSVCGVVTGTEVIAKANHSYNSAVIAPTCTEGGYTTYTCSACGDTYTADETTAAGHNSDNGTVTKQATCTVTGVKTYKCTICGTVLRTETIAKTEHSYQTFTSGATCTKTGSKIIKCTVCSDVKSTEVIPATGHTEVISKQAKNPTCSKAGNTVEKKCSVCGVITVASSTIPAYGHIDGNDDGICDECGTVISPTVNPKPCSCNCHKTGFMGFIWKIINIFNKIFKINPVCECGVKHY